MPQQKPSVNSGTSGGGSWWLAPLYGVINGTLLIPVSISFTSIIFSDAFFQPYLPRLVKLVLFSSMVHQCAFTAFSSLPFAVGQVQDAGLIFLSAMASSTVHSILEDDPETSDASIISTVLVELALSTFLLGVCLIIMGRVKLASVVQYLPVPVIGGYLAYIGFFCGKAGIQMMAGPLPLQWLPGTVMGVVMYLLLRRYRSPLVLPCSMVFTLVVFYASVVAISGWTLDDARDSGWLNPLQTNSSSGDSIFDSFALFSINAGIRWHVMPKQVLSWLAMVLVVAFSSSLDVAAIEMELGLPLDYNRELSMVGLSNLFGLFSGSYIFSQTIFNMKMGIFSRLCGLSIACLELIMVLLPISITAFVPKCFFGSLLILISTDLMYEWLIMARSKMMGVEYLVCLATFCAIQLVGIEGGLGLGILFASVAFVVSYATIATTVSPSFRSSNVVRTFEERSVLIANQQKVITLTLSGYIFFASAVKILEDVKSKVALNVAATVRSDSDYEGQFASGGEAGEGDGEKDEESGRRADQQSLFSYTPVKGTGSSGPSPAKPSSIKSLSKSLKLSTSSGHLYGAIAGNDSDVDLSFSSPVSSPSQSGNFIEQASVPLSVYDLGADAIARLHLKFEQDTNASSNQSARVYDPLDHSLLATVWSNQSLFREAKKASAGSLIEMQTSPRARAANASAHSVTLGFTETLFSFLQADGPSTPPATSSEESAAETKVETKSVLFRGQSSDTSRDPSHRESSPARVDSNHSTEYLVLDFSHTLGVDATAARSCFLMIVQLMRASRVTVVFANMSPHIQDLLTANGVVKSSDIVIPRLDDALEWCEEEILRKALKGGRMRDPTYYASAWARRHGDTGGVAGGSSLSHASSSMSFSSSSNLAASDGQRSPSRSFATEADRQLTHSARALRRILEDYLEVSNNRAVSQLLSTTLLLQFFSRHTVREGDIIFDVHQPATHIFFIEEGEVELVSRKGGGGGGGGGGGRDPNPFTVERVNKIAAGGIFGEAAFFLGTNSTLRALALGPCTLWTLSRDSLSRMEVQQPRTCLCIQHILVKSLSINALVQQSQDNSHGLFD